MIRLLPTLVLIVIVQSQEFQKEADPELNCIRNERARKNDRVLMSYNGLLGDGKSFDKGLADFTLGQKKVIAGWEKGFSGQCAGEKITMIIPPELGYGNSTADKVPANSTLYFLTSLQAVVRTTKEPLGGDCSEGEKARPGQDVSFKINGRVASPEGVGKSFIDKPSFEFRFGKKTSVNFVRGLEKVLTGACIGEKLMVMMGPELAYQEKGNKNYQNGRSFEAVPPNASLVLEIEILKVRNKKPDDSGLVLGFLDKISSGNLGSFSG